MRLVPAAQAKSAAGSGAPGFDGLLDFARRAVARVDEPEPFGH
jgi:hypothetical protein